MEKLSIIIPVYQNELNLPHTYPAIKEELDRNNNIDNYELVFVDDGSTDNSFKELQKIYESDKKHITIIKFSRNFGQVAAWQAGLSNSSGDCMAVISADLQDPPSLISDMFMEWKNKNKIVIAARKHREDSYGSKITSKIFYGLMRRFSPLSVPIGGYDCFLIDKSIRDILLKMKERNAFLQGQILWTGYKPKIIYYNRRKRESGKTQWSIFKKVKYFIDGIFGYSFFPIRLITSAGMVLFLIGTFYSIGLIFQRIYFGTRMVGWTSIMILIVILSGFQMMMMGIIGEYLWRNFDETRKRPLYLIEQIKKSDNSI